MLQIKLLQGKDIETLTDKVNAFLASLSSEAVKGIDVNDTKWIAVIQYEHKDEWEGKMCCDCQHWDDSGSDDAVVGLCQECGGRRRFSAKACECFKDVRR